MKLIIDIPDDDFNFIKDLDFAVCNRGNCKTIQYNVINAIKTGTIIPEGHDRLIVQMGDMKVMIMP